MTLRSETLVYHDGTLALHGTLWRDDHATALRPGILVMPAGGGLNDFARDRARALAEFGYVALAADPFGGAALARDFAEAERFTASFNADPGAFRARARAGLDALAACPGVDARRLGAIGYCLGGSFVLELARARAPLAGVVSFHGLVQPRLPAAEAGIAARVLVCNGGRDPYVPPAALAAFTAEMLAAGADFQIITWADALHSFTNPQAGAYGDPRLGYDARADAQSWLAMTRFFADLFGPPQEAR